MSTTALLVASNVLLWLCVLLLGMLVFLLTRQIGVLYERVAPAGALAVNGTLRAGDPAPALSLQTLDGGLVEVGGVRPGRAQLLFWLSPDCPVCKSLLPALRSAAAAERRWLDTVLCSDGPEQDHAGFRARQELTAFPYVVSELLGKRYGVAKLPYAVLVDEGGKIASLGIINSREHLDSLFEAKERKVASIQEHLARREREGTAGDGAVQHYEVGKP